MNVVQNDPRTQNGKTLGVASDVVFGILGGGQADFASSYGDLSDDDLAILYAYWLQKGHVEELAEAFGQHLSGADIKNPVIVDLGCGPFTGGLAVASALEAENIFTYVGMDRAPAMHRLGEKLAIATAKHRGSDVTRIWTTGLRQVPWKAPPRWRPVVVIVSYLLASPTLNPLDLVNDLDELLQKIGRGQVTLLYTNSKHEYNNVNFPPFRDALESIGIELIKDELGSIETSSKIRTLRYALFHRSTQNILELE